MVMKVVIFACVLIACAFADGTLNPPALDCLFHLSTTNQTGFKLHTYGMLKDDPYPVAIMKRIDEEGNYLLIRSDIGDGHQGYYYSTYKVDKDICFVNYYPKESLAREARKYLENITMAFDYVDDGEVVDCPNGTKRACMRYHNADSEFVTVDDIGRYVIIPDETVVAYYAAPKLTHFNPIIYCDHNPIPPENMCPNEPSESSSVNPSTHSIPTSSASGVKVSVIVTAALLSMALL